MFELMESLTVDAAGGAASGRATVPIDHPSFPFLADHFVGAPVLPGSLQIELCAQIAGPLAEEVTALQHGTERWAFLGLVRHAAFLEPAVLPARLVISAQVKRAEPSNVAVATSLAREDWRDALSRRAGDGAPRGGRHLGRGYSSVPRARGGLEGACRWREGARRDHRCGSGGPRGRRLSHQARSLLFAAGARWHRRRGAATGRSGDEAVLARRGSPTARNAPRGRQAALSDVRPVLGRPRRVPSRARDRRHHRGRGDAGRAHGRGIRGSRARGSENAVPARLARHQCHRDRRARPSCPATSIRSPSRLPWVHSVDARADRISTAERLLVVGGGASAAEVLGIWLRDASARRASLRSRCARRCGRYQAAILGLDVHYLSWLPEHLPARPIGPWVAPKDGMFGFAVPRAIRAGAIERVPAVARYDADAVHLSPDKAGGCAAIA